MESNLFSLSGKTALVTGGGRGIGLAIAKGLAEHGADVAIAARSKEQLEATARQIHADTGRKIRTFPFDLGGIEGIDDFFESVIAETNGIDILVNCAGTTIRGPAEDVDLKTWSKVIEVNLTSAFVLSQAFCRHRKKMGKSGRIINIGSLTCHAARPTTAAYASSKGGLLSLTKTLAVEWAKYNINVNAIGPGYIATELTEPLQADEDLNRWVLSKTPLARWGQDRHGGPARLASGRIYHRADYLRRRRLARPALGVEAGPRAPARDALRCCPNAENESGQPHGVAPATKEKHYE